MKILKRETFSPVHVCPGDSISLVSEGKVLASETVTRTLRVDTGIIFDLEAAECDELGLSDGIGGVFGVSSGEGASSDET